MRGYADPGIARTPTTGHSSRRRCTTVTTRAPVRVAPPAWKASGVCERGRPDPIRADRLLAPAGGRGFCLPDTRRTSHPMSILEPAALAASISADELRARLDDPTLTIVDVRPIAAFNGWRL